MSVGPQLSPAYAGTRGVTLPHYAPEDCGAGIVHLGAGAFFRAHLADYTDRALGGAGGGDWRIVAAGLRSASSIAPLAAQGGRYSLTLRTGGAEAQPELRVIGSIAQALCARSDQGLALRRRMSAPTTRIVSLTVTESGYGLDAARRALDHRDPGIAADLAAPERACSSVGLIVQALRTRRAAGIAPFTVLSCDNLPGNGRLLRRAVLAFADLIDPKLAGWIAAQVAFPSTMVDRITPAPTAALRAEVQARLGLRDEAAVECEGFSQWVIEDHFCDGRPDWQKAGALMVEDVAGYEEMKLRMLNGAHSMLAYAGFLSGHRYVRDVMANPALARLVDQHIQSAALGLRPLGGIDFDAYRHDLMTRFANPAIAHETRQIAMDGTQKLPQRLFAPALSALERAEALEPFAFACAAWMRYATGRDAQGGPFDICDPRAAEIAKALQGQQGAAQIIAALSALPGLIPAQLAASDRWQSALNAHLGVILSEGMEAAIERAAAARPGRHAPGLGKGAQ